MSENIQLICREPEIYCLKIPLPGSPLKSLNSYLIRSQGESLLVDTGFRNPICSRVMEECLYELKVDRTKMNIFITHCHTDHMGSVLDIMGTETKVLVSEKDYRVLEGHLRGNYWEEGEKRFLSEGFPREELDMVRDENPSRIYMPENMFPVSHIKAGDTWKVGVWDGIFVDTKGHSPGHMSLYFPESEILILGDHVLFDISPNITNWVGVEDSLGDYLDSLNRIYALPVRIALPGHRGVSMGLKERIKELKEHHQIRLEQMMQAIYKNPGMTAYQIAAGTKWNMHGKRWDEAPKSQKWFAVGETIAHLDYLCIREALHKKRNEGIFRYSV